MLDILSEGCYLEWGGVFAVARRSGSMPAPGELARGTPPVAGTTGLEGGKSRARGVGREARWAAAAACEQMFPSSGGACRDVQGPGPCLSGGVSCGGGGWPTLGSDVRRSPRRPGLRLSDTQARDRGLMLRVPAWSRESGTLATRKQGHCAAWEFQLSHSRRGRFDGDRGSDSQCDDRYECLSEVFHGLRLWCW